MKSSVLLSLFLLLIQVAVKAQAVPSSTPIRLNCGQPAQLKNSPLVFVDGFETDMHSMVLDPNSIQEINVLKDSAAIRLYGDKAKNGVILIKTKQGTTVRKVGDFVNVQNKYNSSVQCIQLNGQMLTDMKRLIIDDKALVSTMISSEVQMDKENCTMSFNDTLVITARLEGNKK